MAWNGSGVYALPNPAAYPSSGAVISSTDYKAVLADISTALNNCVAKDGQNAMSGDLSLGGNDITNVQSITADSGAIDAIDAESLQFPQPGVPSADRTTLDAYDEYVWVPTVAGATVTVTSAHYTKIGRLVLLQMDLTWPSTADTTSIVFSGLPFTTQNVYQACAVGYSNHGSPLYITVLPNTTTANLVLADSTNVTNAGMSTKRLIATIVYNAAA